MDNTAKKMTVAEWKQQKFEPWKRQMDVYRAEREIQMGKLKEHAGQLQTIVAMLAEGKTKQATLAWNTLQLHPKLKDVRVSPDGEILTLVAMDGAPQVLKLDQLIGELEAMFKGQSNS